MHSCRKDNGFGVLSAALLALLLALLTGLTGCGGGGGGSGPGPGPTGSVTLLGRVLLADTGNPPASATITVNGHSATTKPDGTFTLTSVATSATTATVASSGELTRTLALHIPTNTKTVDLGDIYLSKTSYNASVSGKVVTPKNGANVAVPNATVLVAGSSAVTGTDGSFSITNLPAGLGGDLSTPLGVVRATGYLDKQIFTTAALNDGLNQLDPIIIQTGAGSTPGQPYTVYGHVTHSGGGSISVEILSGGTVLGSPAQVDTSGNYYFWVAPGDYTVIALSGSTQSAPVAVHVASTDGPPVQADITF